MAVQYKIRTSVLILSDTHSMDFDLSAGFVDVAIHCGDLTDGSKLEEFRKTIKCLARIDSPLKLAIAGNHDFTLDIPAFDKKVSEASPPLDPESVAKEYGRADEARRLFEEARDVGVILLDEGDHSFVLENGVLLTVYASPYTPSMGSWGFQYHPEQGHSFSIAEGTAIVVTHGPPKGIMDYTYGRERAGCPQLFEAIAQAKPQVHCFGHIHEGWGAKQVVWRETHGGPVTHFTAIDNGMSTVVEKLSTLEPSRVDSSDDLESKRKKMEKYKQDGCVKVDQSSLDDSQERKTQTLFVNASMSDIAVELSQLPWIVYVDLSAAT